MTSPPRHPRRGDRARARVSGWLHPTRIVGIRVLLILALGALIWAVVLAGPVLLIWKVIHP